MIPFRRILVPVDGSATSNHALSVALEMARAADGRVRLVHFVDPLDFVTGFEGSSEIFTMLREGAARVLQQVADSVKSAGVPVETHLAERPGDRLGVVIAREAKAWNADLVVLGTHGRRGMQRALLGSGAEQIIRLAPVPVLVIRGDEDGA